MSILRYTTLDFCRDLKAEIVLGLAGKERCLSRMMVYFSKKMMIGSAALQLFFCQLVFALPSEAYLSEDFEVAQAAVEELIEKDDNERLFEVVRNSSFPELRRRAIIEIDLKGSLEVDRFLLALDFLSVLEPEDGAEKRAEKIELMKSLATKVAFKVEELPPQNYSKEAIEEFIILVRTKMEVGDSAQKKRVTDSFNNSIEKTAPRFPNRSIQAEVKEEDSFSLVWLYWALGISIIGGGWVLFGSDFNLLGSKTGELDKD